MIQKDQPTIFGKTVVVAVSSIHDGTMKFGIDSDNETYKNRGRFLGSIGISPAHATLVRVTYDTGDFARYRTVSNHEKAAGMAPASVIAPADALAVDQPDQALFLPLADCIGAVLFDPIRKVLMVSHLGRHSIEVNGGAKSVQFLKDAFHIRPADLQIWLSPAAGKASYPLRAFKGRGMHEVLIEQFAGAGVARANIQASSVDTARDSNYFSHSEYLKDTTLPNGRFAVVAMMRAQGEPAV
jgi:copper oxidase (laccase) domain-containing protein